jgi:hypothetical protein
MLPPAPADRSATPREPECPCRRELRARLFWAARWLLGGNRFHAGPVEVSISDGRSDQSGQIIVFRPRHGDEIYDAGHGPDGLSVLAELAPRLMAALLSPDEFKILRTISDRGPLGAKQLIAATAIERSRCYVLLSELSQRGVLRESLDGYEVADVEVWVAISDPSRVHTVLPAA